MNDWGAAFHRGRFKMRICTAAHILERHNVTLPTPYVAEIFPDDDSKLSILFQSDVALANHVTEMAPSAIEIVHATGESVEVLANLLQERWRAVLSKASAAAVQAIRRAKGAA